MVLWPSFPLLPHPHPHFVLSLSTGVSPVSSFVLQVVALRLAALRPVKAGERLAILVHAPAVSPPPAFRWTALWGGGGGARETSQDPGET